MSNILSGEKLQYIADIYVGFPEDFLWNASIDNQKHKQKNLLEITNAYNNPKIVFCYSHRITKLAEVIEHFNNEFILITHNSDENIAYDSPEKKIYIEKICNFQKLLKWYAQNLCIEHNKIHFLPIGIANDQWEHGANFNFYYQNFYNKTINKVSK